MSLIHLPLPSTSPTSWLKAEWEHKTTFLHNSVTEPSQRTSSWFVTLITLGHIVSRTHWLFPSCLLQGTEPKQWYTTQFFGRWRQAALSARKRQKGGKSIPVFSANKKSPGNKMFLLWLRQLCLGKSLATAYHWREPQCCPVCNLWLLVAVDKH